METNTKKNKNGKMEKFVCSGGDGGNGHPKIYLTIGETEQSISCRESKSSKDIGLIFHF